VLVEARLDRSAAALAKEGSVFWIVRPEVGVANITGLGTIITGPYIEVLPGNGPKKKSFEGAATSPNKREGKGLRIVLIALNRGSLRPGSPVYYRGIEVGAVQDHRLSADARMVELDVFIQQRYAPLVRKESRFWNVSGVNVDFGLFKGAQVNVESLKSVVSGGLTFATPEEGKGGEAVKDGAIFRLYEEPKKEWLEWSPAISIPSKTAE
jgi:paraquat-inducible protein B